jgi:hypothetical protein
MMDTTDVEIWLRGNNHAATERVTVAADPNAWTDADVRALLTEMLLAIERQKNPGGDPPPVRLTGFNWIVNPDSTGVLVHLEMQMGTASAGPFAIDEARLTGMITRALAAPDTPSPVVH